MLLLLLFLFPAPALAQKGSEKAARALYEEGLDLYEKGRFADAADTFDLALKRMDRASIRVLLASSLAKSGRCDRVAGLVEGIAWDQIPANAQAEARERTRDALARCGKTEKKAEKASPADMVEIPAGDFFMGCNESKDKECFDDEKPYHRVYVSGFWMDRTEVTVEAYGKCVAANRCVAPNTGGSCNWGVAGRSDHPINCVDWTQAKAYCEWAGKRLPTEAEWEKAARGTDGRVYPWGDEKATCSRAVMDDGSGNGCGRGNVTWPVCSKPAGNSAQGICDLAGNVREWVSDWKAAYSSEFQRDPKGPVGGTGRVLRGGSWLINARSVRASSRGVNVPSSRGGFGFRCARTVSP